ncbi:hypothetical protein HY338_01355 [Candidatus Gottesmanbacteria bacterium]|nr:hypothetical protein [Candidatus Gottesmanbacteria bacterium]
MSKRVARLFISIVLLSVGLIFSSKSVYGARSIKIDSFKDSFHNDEEGEAQVILTGFDVGEEIHIKGAFAGNDSTNYFGFTKIGGEWIKNSAKSEDQPVVTVNNWDNKLKIKPDLTDTGFHGTDDYNFKIGFYYVTTGGNLSSVNWSDNVKVHIDFVPSPTAIPTVLPTITVTTAPTANPTITSKVIIKTNPTITSVPTKINSTITIDKPTITGNVLLEVTTLPGIEEISNKNFDTSGSANNVLGINDKKKTKSFNGQIVIGLLIIGAIICFITGIYLSIRIIKRKEQTENPL